MRNEKTNVLTVGAAHIRKLYEETENGILNLTIYPENGDDEYTEECPMTWTEEEAEDLVKKFETMVSALTKIAEVENQLTVAEPDETLLTEEEWDIFKTYIAPFMNPPFDMEQLISIWEKEEFEELTQEEKELSDRYWDWFEDLCLSQLPYLRCNPMNLIQRARRYERLCFLKAPKVVLSNEVCCLAEMMAKYYYGAPDTYTCRCCGQEYDLAPSWGCVAYSICPNCMWEEDNSKEEEYSDTNHASLQDYRKAYLEKKN